MSHLAFQSLICRFCPSGPRVVIEGAVEFAASSPGLRWAADCLHSAVAQDELRRHGAAQGGWGSVFFPWLTPES